MVDQKQGGDGPSPAATVMRIISTSKVQISFFIGIVAVLSGLVPFTKQCGQFIQRAKNSAPEDYKFPEFADMKIGLYYCVFFYVTHIIWLFVVPPLLEPIIKVQNDVRDRKKRSRKMALMIYSFVWYSISSMWGYQILKDTDFFPRCLGGRGDIWKTFEEFPFQKEIPGMRMYYMANFGWHLEGLVKQLTLDGLRPDIIEMCLHHIVTIYLVGGSYLINYVNIGAIIEWLHDFTDIFISAVRGVTECKWYQLSYVVMPLTLTFWFYGRICVFTYIIYVMHTTEVMGSEHGDHYIMNYIVAGVSTILVLNIWWLKMMSGMVYSALTKGKVEDVTANFQKNEKGEKVKKTTAK